MPRALLANNAVSTLSAAITSTSATTFTVVSGATFPVPTGAQYYYLTLLDSANIPEIVKVTGLVSNTFTVVRAQDNTLARTFLLGAKVSLNLTAATVNELAPLTGEGTSGTWSISISGAAASAAAYTGTLAAIGAQAALGFTPYNATNPSGYITSSANISGNAATATNATAAQVATTQAVGDQSVNIANCLFVNPAYSKAASGYVKLPSGVLIQWGTSSGASPAVTFPVAFPSACTFATSIPTNAPTSAPVPYISAYSTSGFTTTFAGTSTAWLWFAIGY